jgi:hypothetical protein
MADLITYKKLAITGGGANALDGIDGAALVGNELAFVTVSGVMYDYILNATIGGAESSPDKITPDTNPGNKRWILQRGDVLLDEAVALSTKAPKADPLFTGDVRGTTPNKAFTSVNPTNAGVLYNGGNGTVVIGDNQSITITCGYSSALVAIGENSGLAALFWVEYTSATIVKLADVSTRWQVTDVDGNPGWAMFKGPNSGTFTIKNYMNAGKSLNINILGCVASATAPA